MSARLDNLHFRAAELTHRRRMADKNVLLDRPQTFETAVPYSYEKVELPPRRSWHFWQPFVEVGVFIAFVLGIVAYVHLQQADGREHRQCSVWFHAPSFRSLLPHGDTWTTYTNGITGEAVISRGRNNKALGVLLLASSEASGSRAAGVLEDSYPLMCKDVVLRIKIQEDSAAGELERQIASHLESHLWGIVIIESFERASAQVIQTLSAAMEVKGTMHGLRADAAIFFMCMTVPAAAAAGDLPESFHENAGPYVEEHLRALYVREAGVVNVVGDGGASSMQHKPIKLRGSGSVQAEVPVSATEEFVTTFKRVVGFVVPVVERS